MNLWIVGNGLDKSHGYKTGYLDFKEWMEQQLKGTTLFDVVPNLPSLVIGNHGEEVIDEGDAVKVLMWLLSNNKQLDDEWNNFEESLYYLDLESVLEENSWFVDDNSRDREGDINPFKQGAYYTEIAESIRSSAQYMHIVFKQWIESVDIKRNRMIPVLQKSADDSLFLSFNYTETLEKIYGILPKNVCHIHGLRKQNHYSLNNDYNNLIIGHGNLNKKNYDHINIEAAEVLEDIIEKLRKPTEAIIDNNLYFWQQIQNSNIDKVYSYGFSYGDVDLAYIRHIVRLLSDKHITWYLHNYNDKDNINYEIKLRDCGFKDSIERFSDDMIKI